MASPIASDISKGPAMPSMPPRTVVCFLAHHCGHCENHMQALMHLGCILRQNRIPVELMFSFQSLNPGTKLSRWLGEFPPEAVAFPLIAAFDNGKFHSKLVGAHPLAAMMVWLMDVWGKEVIPDSHDFTLLSESRTVAAVAQVPYDTSFNDLVAKSSPPPGGVSGGGRNRTPTISVDALRIKGGGRGDPTAIVEKNTAAPAAAAPETDPVAVPAPAASKIPHADQIRAAIGDTVARKGASIMSIVVDSAKTKTNGMAFVATPEGPKERGILIKFAVEAKKPMKVSCEAQDESVALPSIQEALDKCAKANTLVRGDVHDFVKSIHDALNT